MIGRVGGFVFYCRLVSSAAPATENKRIINPMVLSWPVPSVLSRCAKLLQVFGVGFGLCIAGSVASAATIHVTTTSDSVVPGSGCSLREAIINAETRSYAGSYDCEPGTSGVNTIVLLAERFDLRSTLSDDASLATGDLDITTSMEIIGDGPQWTVLDAGGTGRLFDVHAGGNLLLRGVSVHNGQAPSEGGAIRVGGGGVLELQHSAVRLSVAGSESGAGRGGAVYVAAGATAIFDSVELLANRALGAPGSGFGGALYCADGCSLSVQRSTVSNNNAAATGAGLHIEPGSGSVELTSTTVGDNRAPLAAGIFTGRQIALDRVVLADNATADHAPDVVGDDLWCGVALDDASVSRSFAEFPTAGCSTSPTFWTRADIATLEKSLLTDAISQPVDGVPTRVQGLRNELRAVVGGSACDLDGDQWGQLLPSGSSCDAGAYQFAPLSVSPMSGNVAIDGAPGTFYVRLASTPASPLKVEVYAENGDTDECSFVPRVVTFDPAASDFSRYQLLAVDPGELFDTLRFGATYRVCNLRARTLASDVAEPAYAAPVAFLGARSGVVSFRLKDGAPAALLALSYPQFGEYLTFGSTLVGIGAERYFTLNPNGSDWNVTGYELSGRDPSRFEVLQDSLAVTQAGGSVPFRVKCLPGGPLGEYLAQLTLHTDVHGDLLFGLQCRVMHRLYLTTSHDHVGEGEVLTLTAELDSAENFAGPFTVTLSVPGGGTAVSGVDFEDFSRQLVFGANQSRASVSVPIVDDAEVEGEETLLARLVLDSPVAFLETATGLPEIIRSVAIVDNDVESAELFLSMTGIPEQVDPDTMVYDAVYTVANVGTSPLERVKIVLEMEGPSRVLSFTVPGNNDVHCQIADAYDQVTCSISGQFLPGESVSFVGAIRLAEMNRSPQTDLSGGVRLKASAVTAETPFREVDAEVQADYTLRAPGVYTASGGLVHVQWLLVLALLCLRRLVIRYGGRRFCEGSPHV